VLTPGCNKSVAKMVVLQVIMSLFVFRGDGSAVPSEVRIGLDRFTFHTLCTSLKQYFFRASLYTYQRITNLH